MEARHEDGVQELGDLEPGTRQRDRLRARVADIAWTALCVVLALWAVWGVVGVARGTAGWVYSAVACVLLAVALYARTVSARRGDVRPGR
ncbi:hypothetical protein [Streptomyces sp. NRRL S-37]|uniref:hypothetical protein n=1 Tax=Streptomyces sp. NRRL S-37 TaxID=1463903 RepID=UPI0004C8210B|nr:hypothetical protein [Streptomyces sp. NRRL S-37]